MMPLRYTFHDSPVGPLMLAGDGDALHAVSFPSGHGARRPKPDWVRDDGAFDAVRRQLDAWFAGTRTDFDLPLAYDGSPFQCAVWNAMRAIPYGETLSYGAMARKISGDVAASRAVGIACGENPLPVVIPCHRVVGADGSLTGFGGGLETKRWLLDHERRVRPLPGHQMSLFG